MESFKEKFINMENNNYIPTQEQFTIVIGKFEKILEKYPKAQVQMEQCIIKDMGFPKCHIGWFAYINDIHTLFNADKLLCQDLGVDDIRFWAHNNPKIWGNEQGSRMYWEPSAFGLDNHLVTFPLQHIIDHWKGVKERALQHEN